MMIYSDFEWLLSVNLYGIIRYGVRQSDRIENRCRLQYMVGFWVCVVEGAYAAEPILDLLQDGKYPHPLFSMTSNRYQWTCFYTSMIENIEITIQDILALSGKGFKLVYSRNFSKKQGKKSQKSSIYKGLRAMDKMNFFTRRCEKVLHLQHYRIYRFYL